MEKYKEQKIVILINLNKSDHNLILHGIKLSSIFNKELCLLNVYPENNTFDPEQIKKILENYKSTILNDIPHLKVSSLIINKHLINHLESLVDNFESVLFITSANNYKKHSKALRISPVPFLFINPDVTKIPDYKRIITPVDLRRENRDSALWCSYFGRFNKSEIIAIAATEKYKDNIKEVTKNIKKLKALLNKFGIFHKIVKGKKNSFKIHFETLDLAFKTNSSLMIMLSSSFATPIDHLIGLPEKKIINMAGNLAIMFVNPRKDMYIMCD